MKFVDLWSSMKVPHTPLSSVLLLLNVKYPFLDQRLCYSSGKPIICEVFFNEMSCINPRFTCCLLLTVLSNVVKHDLQTSLYSRQMLL